MFFMSINITRVLILYIDVLFFVFLLLGVAPYMGLFHFIIKNVSQKLLFFRQPHVYMMLVTKMIQLLKNENILFLNCYIIRRVSLSQPNEPENDTNAPIDIRNMTRYILPRSYPLSRSHHENYLRRLNSRNITIQGLQILNGADFDFNGSIFKILVIILFLNI